MALTKGQKTFLDRVLVGGKTIDDLSGDDKDMALKIFMSNPPDVLTYIKGDEQKVDTYNDLLNSPGMVERAEKLAKAKRVQNNLDTAIGLFNDAYDSYLAEEQIRVGEQQLEGVEKAVPPSDVKPLPELEAALAKSRQLGDPTAAISQAEQQIERAGRGAIRAAQLGSRGQAGGLGAQAQAIHQANLSQRAQIPLMAQEIQRQGLATQIPLIGQKQQIELFNQQTAARMFPHLLHRQMTEEEQAGLTLQAGLQGRQDAIRGYAERIPQIVGNIYSEQYRHLPPEVGPYVSGLDYGQIG
jgi:hypothetical protein